MARQVQIFFNTLVDIFTATKNKKQTNKQKIVLSMAILVISFLKGNEERQRLMRRNIIRYVLLSYCMATRAVSFRVKKRFPDLQHLVDAGLMREDEYKVG